MFLKAFLLITFLNYVNERKIPLIGSLSTENFVLNFNFEIFIELFIFSILSNLLTNRKAYDFTLLALSIIDLSIIKTPFSGKNDVLNHA